MLILVIDNYDSFTYNLVHLLGRHTDDVKVARNDEITLEEVKALMPDGILISPGPGRPEDAGITQDVIRIFGHAVPILGVCLGHQAIGQVYGGRVVNAPELMHGKTSPIQHDGHTVFRGVPQNFTATRYHSLILDRTDLPGELMISAQTQDGLVMGVRHRAYLTEGIQFHPESIMTEIGGQLIANWVGSLMGVDPAGIAEIDLEVEAEDEEAAPDLAGSAEPKKPKDKQHDPDPNEEETLVFEDGMSPYEYLMQKREQEREAEEQDKT
jgi:anthranilate synthase/aminodeoxychorismate synthase-like glutamine amidotransferase